MNLRRDIGYSQRELARAIEMTAPALSSIEQGHSKPRSWNLIAIARVLRVPPDYLLDEDAPYPCESLRMQGAPEGEAGAKVSIEVRQEELKVQRPAKKKRPEKKSKKK